MQPFSVAASIREALELNALPPTVEVVLDLPPDLPPALADAGQMRIVLGNLIRNAREAMPNGGRLTITARSTEQGIEIAVTDTGVGIAAEQLHRIMEPLYSTKARGMGLGLPIARAILDKNQGSLRVVSANGQGSTFTVRLTAVGAPGGGPAS